MTGSSSKLLQIQGKWYQERNKKQGNRLTRRPCTGDRFEILIFEGKKKCWYLQESSKNVCNMDIHFDWQACDSRVKFAFRLRGYSILLFKGQNRIISGRHSLFQFFPLLDASGARALVATQVPQSATRQRCDAMSSCRPKCTFVVHLLFFVEHRWRSPFFQVFPCSIHLLSTSNNGSIGFTPQTTSKMISLSKDILLVSKIIYPPDDYTTACATCASSVMPTPQSPPPWWSYDSMCNVCIFRNVKEVLVKNVNTPPPHPPPPPPLDDHPTACATC